ncbi:MAG TPA: DMT family transporter [Candidatus Saccharimonadales bacterium]|nr:DMT family transporter [Candidatus Saccharimonadales bacterium]
MGTTTTTKAKGASSLLGAAFIIGTFGLWVRLISPMLGNAAQTAGRFGIAALLLGGFLLIRHKVARLARRELFFAAIIGVAGFGTGFLFTISANSTKITNSLALLYAGGIISAMLFGTVFLKEKLHFNKVIAGVVALLGLLMYAQDFSALSLGAIAAVGAGVCDSIAHVFRKQLRNVDRNTIVFYQYAVGAVVAICFTLFSGEHIVKAVSFWPIIGLVAYGMASVGLGKLLLYGFGHFDVNAGAVILATQLLFAGILGAVFLREFPSVRELAGVSLIFLASVCAVVDLNKYFQKLTGRSPAPELDPNNT